MFYVSLKAQLGVIIHIYIYVNSSYSIDIWHLLFRTFCTVYPYDSSSMSVPNNFPTSK